MKKHFIKGLHAAWWLIYLAFFCGVYLLPDEHDSYQDLPELAVLVLLSGSIAFYGAYYWLFNRYLQKRAWTRLLFAIVVLSISAAVPAAAAVVFQVYLLIGIHAEAAAWLQLCAGFGFLALLNAGIGLLLRVFLAWYREGKRVAHELQQLRMHLQPHFLFNTLHNINILISNEPDAASAYLEKLSELLRYLLYGANANEAPLSEEITFIQNYLELQNLRTSNINYAIFRVDGDPNGKMIPPLLFIPFVENAFKHTLNKKIHGAIEMELFIRPGELYFRCTNKIGETEKKPGSDGGLGLEIARRRLALLYGNSFNLRTGPNDGIFTVELTIEKLC